MLDIFGCIWKVKPRYSTLSLRFPASTNTQLLKFSKKLSSEQLKHRKLQGCQRHLLWQSGLHDGHECARGDRARDFQGSFMKPHFFLWMLNYVELDPRSLKFSHNIVQDLRKFSSLHKSDISWGTLSYLWNANFRAITWYTFWSSSPNPHWLTNTSPCEEYAHVSQRHVSDHLTPDCLCGYCIILSFLCSLSLVIFSHARSSGLASLNGQSPCLKMNPATSHIICLPFQELLQFAYILQVYQLLMFDVLVSRTATFVLPSRRPRRWRWCRSSVPKRPPLSGRRRRPGSPRRWWRRSCGNTQITRCSKQDTGRKKGPRDSRDHGTWRAMLPGSELKTM